MMDPAIALPASFVEMRQKLIAEYGARALDAVIGQALCEKCGPRPSGFATNTACAFQSFAEFQKTSALLCEKTAKGVNGKRCPRCAGAMTQSWVHYHAHDEGRQADLVLRWIPKQSLFGRSTSELLWWNPHGSFSPAQPLSGAEETRFLRDGLIRAVQAAFELGDAQSAVKLLEVARARYPADDGLLIFVPQLLRAGYGRLSLALSEAHAKNHPDRADGHNWVGETLFQCISHRLEPETRLEDAKLAFRRALEIEPGRVNAALGLGNVLRALKLKGEARQLYEDLAAKHPHLAEVRFNLGTLVLDEDPNAALKWFEQGEALDARDPDYPIGICRALVKLGRKGDARHALARAKALAPTHPRYQELDSAVASESN